MVNNTAIIRELQIHTPLLRKIVELLEERKCQEKLAG